MIKKNWLLVFLAYYLTISYSKAQAYTNYFIGNTQDVQTSPTGGICLMGGATENDEAMRWFLRRAVGGDVLVLRTSGSDGYNDYFYSQLGINVNSVETIVFNQSSAAQDAYIQQKISQAEGIWFAGGNQANYVNYWRNTAIDSLINIAVRDRNIVIGATSAGMAIQGAFYFSAQNGTISSSQALQNPYHNSATVDSARFLQNEILANTITDTHFDNPDRKGRLMSFLAKIYTDYQQTARAIACDEYTAVCIDENGIAAVYGDFPNSDDNAYFIQINCELADASPELCSPNQPLDWDRNAQAVRVCQLKGTNSGINTFNLNNWQVHQGGVWQSWSVDNGIFNETAASAINCDLTYLQEYQNHPINFFPNPSADIFYLQSANQPIESISLFDMQGNLLVMIDNPSPNFELNLSLYPPALYIVKVRSLAYTSVHKLVKI
jgi:cyanophycinase-like exopeptidase